MLCCVVGESVGESVGDDANVRCQNKSLRDEATLALKNATALRAAYARRAALPPADKAALLPEYALPHVAMILAGTAQVRLHRKQSFSFFLC